MGKIRRLFTWFPRRPSTVWVVQHTESPHNTVLGVFGDRQSAADLAARAGRQFPGGVIYAEYRIGWQYDRGSRPYRRPAHTN